MKDYLNSNKGYELFCKVNEQASDYIHNLHEARDDAYRDGVQKALQKKEESVTGLDFGIISSSFVNHMIYASMNASKIKEQEATALKRYNQEIDQLQKNIAETLEINIKHYIDSVYIPNAKLALTALLYGCLDSYISDLIENDYFDCKVLNHIDIKRSNELLENLNLSSNKKAILENAFLACPYNIEVYMKALTLDLLDYESFQVAKAFNQNEIILDFLKNNWGVITYPDKFKINYKYIAMYSLFTESNPLDILHSLSNNFAVDIYNAYTNVTNMLHDNKLCMNVLKSYGFEAILHGDTLSKEVANRTIRTIVNESIFEQLVEKCGHEDLFNRIKKLSLEYLDFNSKKELDDYLILKMDQCFEIARKSLLPYANQKKAENEEREKEEELHRQKIEKTKKIKKIVLITCCFLVIIGLILSICIPQWVEKANISKREKYIEERIQQVLIPLEEEMEKETGVDIIMDYSFSLEEDWDNELWYDWDFCVRIPIFEDYRQSSSKQEQDLLIIMNACKIFEEIYKDTLDDLRLIDFKYAETRVVLDYSGSGSLDIRDLSSSETFYYEEYWGNRYLHSLTNEYVLDENSEVVQTAKKEVAYNEALDLMSEQKYEEAIEIFTELDGYKDSKAKILECESAIFELKYKEALTLMSEQKYEEAIDIFTELDGYKDSETKIIECNNAIAEIVESKYEEATTLIADEKYEEALILLNEIGDYKDSKELRKKCKLVTCESGDIITFGTYEQDGQLSNGNEDIEWIVIMRDGNKALVISKYCLEQKPFNSILASVTWKDSTIRTWLNNDFYNNAFSSDERNKIFNTTFLTDEIETTDKVFLLDEEDASLLPISMLKAKATDYVSTSHCYWFLRNTGSVSNVAYVSYDGKLGYYENVDREWWIRPVMWIDVTY